MLPCLQNPPRHLSVALNSRLKPLDQIRCFPKGPHGSKSLGVQISSPKERLWVVEGEMRVLGGGKVVRRKRKGMIWDIDEGENIVTMIMNSLVVRTRAEGTHK